MFFWNTRVKREKLLCVFCFLFFFKYFLSLTPDVLPDSGEPNDPKIPGQGGGTLYRNGRRGKKCASSSISSFVPRSRHRRSQQHEWASSTPSRALCLTVSSPPRSTGPGPHRVAHTVPCAGRLPSLVSFSFYRPLAHEFLEVFCPFIWSATGRVRVHVSLGKSPNVFTSSLWSLDPDDIIHPRSRLLSTFYFRPLSSFCQPPPPPPPPSFSPSTCSRRCRATGRGSSRDQVPDPRLDPLPRLNLFSSISSPMCVVCSLPLVSGRKARQVAANT